MGSGQSKQALWFVLALGGAACATGEEAEGTGSGTGPVSGDGADGTEGDGDGDGDGTPDAEDGAPGDGDGDGDVTPGDGDGDGLAPVASCAGDAPAELDDLISSFEDGTVGVNPVEGRGGGFYVFNDKNDPDAQELEVAPVNRCDDGSSIYSFCTSGSGFTIWGAGFGTDLGLVDPDTMAKSTVDLSAYSGISFWLAARPGSTAPAVKVMVPDVNTAAEGGNCTTDGAAPATEQCDAFVKNVPVPSGWKKVDVAFAELMQGGWGKKVEAFSPEAVFGIQLQFPAGATFDVCFDQLVLTR